ncbi:hypothetical protein E2C01_060005 [Portunus trituberculatus]|uniref:Uncharacterized protein n=1 Tax=Portunus trituberculatus TaxID=210409 RepID=A0A5B7HA67_PORTR|nr:hypothetical protein [Portunus trituberculatus]
MTCNIITVWLGPGQPPRHSPHPGKTFLTLEVNKNQNTTSGGGGGDVVKRESLDQNTAPVAARYSRLVPAVLTSRALSHDCRLPEPGGAAQPGSPSRPLSRVASESRRQRHTLPRHDSHTLPAAKKCSLIYLTIIALLTRGRHVRGAAGGWLEELGATVAGRRLPHCLSQYVCQHRRS